MAGAGGFINIIQNAKKVVFVGSFTAGELNVSVADGQLRIDRDGKAAIAVAEVEHRTFAGRYVVASGQQVLCVTERCVFQLSAEGLELIEIAPGVDRHRDILQRMDFEHFVREPTLLDGRILLPQPMGLRADVLRMPFDALGRKVYTIGNYEGFELGRNVGDAYVAMVAMS